MLVAANFELSNELVGVAQILSVPSRSSTLLPPILDTPLNAPVTQTVAMSPPLSFVALAKYYTKITSILGSY